MHALQHTELCRLQKGQFAMAYTAYSQGDAPEAVMRGMNTARYILRYLSPVKHYAHLEQLIHSWNRTHRRLQKEWEDAFAHWQCFADGADSESDSDDEADPHADDDSDTDGRAYADEF